MGSDKRIIKDKIHKLNVDEVEPKVKQREMLKSKLVDFDIRKKATENTLGKLKPMGVSPSAAASSSSAGRFELKARAIAKAMPRLKPIQEDEEEMKTIIKPAKQHLTYLELSNDP